MEIATNLLVEQVGERLVTSTRQTEHDRLHLHSRIEGKVQHESVHHGDSSAERMSVDADLARLLVCKRALHGSEDRIRRPALCPCEAGVDLNVIGYTREKGGVDTRKKELGVVQNGHAGIFWSVAVQ